MGSLKMLRLLEALDCFMAIRARENKCRTLSAEPLGLSGALWPKKGDDIRRRSGDDLVTGARTAFISINL